MVYMGGKIIMLGVSFDIVHNESVHENMKKIEKLFFLQSSEKNINLFKNRDRGV